jgi:hypothetical protein
MNKENRRKHVALLSGALAIYALLGSTGDPVLGGEHLYLTFTTTSAGGKYSPRNVVAAWVEEEDGTFVKSIATWGRKRAKNLAHWMAADGSSVDGITGATLRDYRNLDVTWNLRNREGKVIPDGVYKIHLEMADDNKNKEKFHHTALTLDKNGTPQRQAIPSQDGFRDIILDYVVTPDVAPQLAAFHPADFTSTSVTLGGRVIDPGGVDPLVSIFWGERDGGTDENAWDHRIDLGVKGEEAFSVTASDLTLGKTYFFRCFAKNSIGPGWSPATGTFAPCELHTVFKPGDKWKFLEGEVHPGKDWTKSGFDDSDWLEGPSGFGYGDEDDATELNAMRGEYLVVYLRKNFRVEHPSRVQSLVFTVDYDDGFVAFINGREVARRNVDADQSHQTAASDSREAGTPETIDLSDHIPAILQGDNVFAIEVHNKEIDSSDLSMVPQLIMAGGGAE